MNHSLEVTHTLSYFWKSCLSLEKYFLPSRRILGLWNYIHSAKPSNEPIYKQTMAIRSAELQNYRTKDTWPRWNLVCTDPTHSAVQPLVSVQSTMPAIATSQTQLQVSFGTIMPEHQNY